MVLKPLKTLLCVMSFFLLFTTNSLTEEKYTANECFEKLSRGTLKFNMALDNAIFKPVAKGYRALPVPIRTGSNNFVNNFVRLLLSFQLRQWSYTYLLNLCNLLFEYLLFHLNHIYKFFLLHIRTVF